MSLCLRNEATPDIQILHRPLIGPGKEDVVRHNIIVAERWHDRDHIVARSSSALVRLAKDLCELIDQKFVLLYNLLLCTRQVFVVVMSRRVARPDDKVYIILDIVVDPSERLVD
jgi:hypothetical protein